VSLYGNRYRDLGLGKGLGLVQELMVQEMTVQEMSCSRIKDSQDIIQFVTRVTTDEGVIFYEICYILQIIVHSHIQHQGYYYKLLNKVSL
jgi:hypothetical protein